MKGCLIRMSLCGSLFFSVFGVAGAAPDKALFVLLGGYNSCNVTTRSDVPPLGIKMQPSFQKLIKGVKTSFPKMKIMTLAGCLDTSAPPEGEGMYVVSDFPTSLKYGDSHHVLHRIEDLLKANPGMVVYLIGHSYGGWMSMYLAQELGGKVDLRAIFTLDPIGPACGAFGVVFGDAACHSAPDDRDNRAIKKRAGAWVNFFQNEDSWLSSSEITEAENHHITFEWGAHSDISQVTSLWKRIDQVVKTTLTK